ncbi:MAG: site-specific DNA-methyltransferase [Methylotenera sp.]|nr:site-specific DNA-methyltransferase [Methylotenera sp.]
MTDSHSPNLSEELKEQLEALVPAAFKDGNLDANTLKQLLGIEIATQDERYGLNWAGKADSYKVLQYPTSATLRPRQDQSVNFEHAQHVFIEGENLEVLKTLQRAYFGKVKMIYIDPPYNTGSDSFIYPDRFQESREDYLKRIESLDIDGKLTKEGLFRKNSKDNGHYHSNWLSMMLPRLYLARNLLRDDGVIFISIDDNEASNLKLLCDEVFGELNFICQFVVNSNSTKNNAKLVSISHEYALAYGKNKELIESWEVEKNNYDEYSRRANQLIERNLSEEEIHNELLELVKYPRFYDFDHYTYADSKGVYQTDNPGGVTTGNIDTEIIHPVTKKPCKKPEGGWRYKHFEMLRLEVEGLLAFGSDETIVPRPKRYLKDYKFQIPKSNLYFDSQSSTKWLKAENLPFDFAKSVDFISHLISVVQADDIVLDFFAGSATTAQAVMELNQKDGGRRKYICVQMPEPTNEASEAYKAGYKTIADISRERIRRVIAQIKQKADLASPMDEKDPNLGFRAFELAPSNFKEWRGDWAETTEELDKQLALMLPTEKKGAQSVDMAFELLLKNGRPLISKLELKTFHETLVYIIWADDANRNVANLVFVLESMQFEALPEILALKPVHIIFLDSVFKNNDSVKVNVALQCETAGVKFSSI